jgi:hypothetical protein
MNIGYIWHPGFPGSVYCDNWFTTMAKNWGYVDATKGGTIDLGFVHANPSQGYSHEDEVARISNSKERYAEGAALMERLTKEIGEQSAMLAGMLGVLKDAMG